MEMEQGPSSLKRKMEGTEPLSPTEDFGMFSSDATSTESDLAIDSESLLCEQKGVILHLKTNPETPHMYILLEWRRGVPDC